MDMWSIFLIICIAVIGFATIRSMRECLNLININKSDMIDLNFAKRVKIFKSESFINLAVTAGVLVLLWSGINIFTLFLFIVLVIELVLVFFALQLSKSDKMHLRPEDEEMTVITIEED